MAHTSSQGINLLKTLRLTGQIEVVTGLLIGGSDEALSIGSAADRSFIKDPVDGYPYIPGSSLKGKLRSSLEESIAGKITSNEPHQCSDVTCLICTVFGPHRTAQHNFGPTRILVRDSVFTEESKGKVREAQQNGRPYYELKTENWIDRRTRVAGSPRTFERVPKEAMFDLEISLRVFEVDGRSDDEEQLKQFVERGLRLIEASYMGASGSRGYGKVRFHLNPWQEV